MTPSTDKDVHATPEHSSSSGSHYESRRVRAVFLNEGRLGAGTLGMARAHEQIQIGLSADARMTARHVQLPPMSLLQRALSHAVPPLKQIDLDFGPLRWHRVQQWRARRALLAELDREPADVLHMFSHSIGLDLIDVAQRIPTVAAVDATLDQVLRLEPWRRYRPWTRATIWPSLRRERRLFEAAAAVVTLSPWAASAVRDIAPGARVEVIPLGIDLHSFRPLPRHERQVPRLLFVAANFAAKGGFDLLDAVGSLCASGEVHLDIVTPTATVSLPNTTTHRLGVGDPRLVALFQEADIYCHPTHADASPFAVLEAMACGAAIVATAVAGIPDQLAHGACGVLVEPRQPEQLRVEIRALLRDAARRRELGAAARARAEIHYDAVGQARRLVELLDAVAR